MIGFNAWYPFVPPKGANFIPLRAATNDSSLVISGTYASSATWLGDYDWDVTLLPDAAGVTAATGKQPKDFRAHGLWIVPHFTTAQTGGQFLDILPAETDLGLANTAAFLANTSIAKSTVMMSQTFFNGAALAGVPLPPFYVPFRQAYRYLNLVQNVNSQDTTRSTTCQIFVDLGGNTKDLQSYNRDSCC